MGVLLEVIVPELLERIKNQRGVRISKGLKPNDSGYIGLENPRAATSSRTECDPTRPERAACISPPQRGGRRIVVNQALQGRHIRSYCIVLEIHGSKASATF